MTARDLALLELDARPLPHLPRAAVKHPGKSTPPPDPRDRALAEKITIGVVKNLLLLQHLTQHYSGRSLKSIDPVVQKILAIALYQLRFLTRIPPSAAVDEAVEQARRFGRPRAGGFVNAVLRNATREPEPPLPAPGNDPRQYARIVLSHPADLFDRLSEVFGPDEALRICRHNQGEAPTIVRLFKGVTAADLQRPDVTLTPHERAGLLVVEPARQSILADWSDRGLAQAQDPTSAAVVPLCDVQPGQLILDRCCGRGTKTLQIRDALGDRGDVFAMDASPHRIDALAALVARRGLANVHVHKAAMAGDLAGALPGAFDRILVDVPCSNSGVLARRAEARYAQGAGPLKSIARLQKRILDDCASLVRGGGRLIYSTCSIWPDENDAIISAFVAAHPEFELRSAHTTLPRSTDSPAEYHDGGYVAVLQRG